MMLEQFVQWFVGSVMHLPPQSEGAAIASFFIKDSIEVSILLLLITHAMSLLRYYLPIERIRTLLTSHRLFGLDYFLATLFGAATPFCSCSSIPLFIGFLEAGIPLGVTLAFLITSPLINEVAVGMMIGLFGWRITLLYVAAGISIGMAGGYLIGKLRLERFVSAVITDTSKMRASVQREHRSVNPILRFASRDAFRIFWNVLPYVLLGIGLGALIHGFVPTGFFEQSVAAQGLFAVPVAVLAGVPLYANATGVIPIIQSLVEKGVPLGTALAFMMAVVGLSLPEALILKRVMRWPLLAAFFGIITLGMILIGYGFNAIL